MIRKAHTLTDDIADAFKRHPGVLFSMQQLEKIGGTGGWRTRVSECRRRLGMTIKNSQRIVKKEDGTQIRQSFYRYTPTESATL